MNLFQMEDSEGNLRGVAAILQQQPVQHPPHLHARLLRQPRGGQVVEAVQAPPLARLIRHHGHR